MFSLRTFIKIVTVLYILSDRQCQAAVDWCSIGCKEGTTHTVCQYPYCSRPGCEFIKGTQADKNYILDIHNKVRDEFAKEKQVSNMMALSWDNDLAYVAECWANQCTFAHDKCRNTENFPYKPLEDKLGVGQNLYKSTSKKTLQGHALAAVQNGWYLGEIKLVPEEVFGSYKQSEDPTKGYGHATQVLWARSAYVGCGWSKGGPGNFHFVYCNYGPAGNTLTLPVFKPGKPTSACPSGVKPNSKYTGLCGEVTYASVNRITPRSVFFVFSLVILLYYVGY